VTDTGEIDSPTVPNACSVSNDPAVEHLHLARQDRRHLAVVGDHHDRRALCVQLFQQRQDRRARGAVQVARRLVREHDRRAADQRACDRQPLALTAGELARSKAHAIGQANPRERLRCSLAPLARASPRVQQPVRHVLERRRVLRQEELLEDEADTRRSHGGLLAEVRFGVV
jgi:hypothetical protein